MNNDNNPEKLLEFLLYLDANNLYGRAMSQSLWIYKRSSFNVMLIAEYSVPGYIVQLDLEYLVKKHDTSYDLLFFVEIKRAPCSKFKKFNPNLEQNVNYKKLQKEKMLN